MTPFVYPKILSDQFSSFFIFIALMLQLKSLGMAIPLFDKLYAPIMIDVIFVFYFPHVLYIALAIFSECVTNQGGLGNNV